MPPSMFALDQPVSSLKQQKPRTTRSKRQRPPEPQINPSEADTKSARHDRLLARNRVAASKCRQRKKVWTEKLETKKAGLQSEHAQLQSQYVNLLQEASQLKDLLLNHAGCDDPNISSWIGNEAVKYARKLSANAQGRPGSLSSQHGIEGVVMRPLSSVGLYGTEPSGESSIMDADDIKTDYSSDGYGPANMGSGRL